MCFPAAKTSSAFRSVYILLYLNVRNDDVVTGKLNNFVAVKDNEMSFGNSA